MTAEQLSCSPAWTTSILASQIAHEAAGKQSARASRIDTCWKVAGSDEMEVRREQNGAVFAAFDHEVFGPTSRMQVAAFFRFVSPEHARLAVVDEQESSLQGFSKAGRAMSIHRFIVSPPTGRVLVIWSRTSLRRRLMLPRRGTERLCRCRSWVEIGEDVQVSGQRGAVVHIVGINPLPKEGFARNTLQSFETDPARGELVDILRGKVVADHADDAHGSEITRR
jgi:hypothetical protein